MLARTVQPYMAVTQFCEAVLKLRKNEIRFVTIRTQVAQNDAAE